MTEFLLQPWPWYVAGPLIGLTVPLLLLFGNKHFGISANLRHICAACLPAGIPFFKYNWRHELWNLFFAAGILAGGWLAVGSLSADTGVVVSASTINYLEQQGLQTDAELMPSALFSSSNIFSLKGLIFFVLGGFLVGFGTRYAGGCTSGHSIMGLSTLQWPSLVATCCFMAGGITTVYLIFPWILSL